MSRILSIYDYAGNSVHQDRILFVGEGVTASHIGRPLVLARAIQEMAEVHFACDPGKQSLVDEDFHWHALPSIPGETFVTRLSRGAAVYTREELRSYVADELALLQRVRPSCVVGDFRVTLGISCRLLNIPYICLTNGHWTRESAQTFPLPDLPVVDFLGVGLTRMAFNLLAPILLKRCIRPFNRVCREYDMPPVNSLQEMYTRADQVLLLDLPEMAPVDALPDHHCYIGPVIWNPACSLPDWWNDVDGDAVYVSAGSSGDAGLINASVCAGRKMDLSVMVATAGRIDSMALSKDVYHAEWLPGNLAAARSRVVICSGGSGPVYQALSMGTPVIGIPSNADQYFAMDSVVSLKAGIMIRSGQVTEQRVRAALAELLNNRVYTRNAERLQQKILRTDTLRNFRSVMDRYLPREENQHAHTL